MAWRLASLSASDARETKAEATVPSCDLAFKVTHQHFCPILLIPNQPFSAGGSTQRHECNQQTGILESHVGGSDDKEDEDNPG